LVEHQLPKLRVVGSSPIARLARFLAHTARAVKIVVRHERIPRPIRWLAAVGLLPLPGPFDEAVLLLVALILLLFYRSELWDAWRQARR
jgi:hypothetical protein